MAKKNETLSQEEWMELRNRIDMLPQEERLNFARFFNLYKRVSVERQPYLLDLIGVFAGVSEDLQTKIPTILEVFLKELLNPKLGSNDDELDDEDDFYDDDEISNYPKYKPAMDVKKYTLKVSLKGSPVPLWRKVDVPSSITLRHLSELIMAFMPWGGDHLNQFRKGRSFYAPEYQREDELPPLSPEIQHLNQEDFALSEVLSEKGKNIEWEYDFGDSWIHEIHLSSISDYKEGEPRVPVLKNAAGLCPPDDCGGIWGYEELLNIHKKRISGKRLTREEREQLDWYGWTRDFDPTSVEVDMLKFFVEDFNEEY